MNALFAINVQRTVLSIGLALATTLIGGWLAWKQGYGGLPLLATEGALILLLLPYFLFGLTDLDDRLRRWLTDRPARIFPLVGMFLIPYLIYALGTGTLAPRSLGILILFIFFPTGCLYFTRRTASTLTWLDVVAILALWLPFDFRWVRTIWTWPQGMAAYTMNTILAVDLAVLLFVAFRRLDDVGYRFRLRRRDLRPLGVNFFSFAAIAIPIGLATGFIRFHPHSDLLRFLGSAAGIFLLVGLPEELLFRGIIQNFLQKTLHRQRLALMLTALIFGAAHLNNGPSPDWRYFLLATIAGLFYGRAYIQTSGLTMPACVHALVDAVWGGFFK